MRNENYSAVQISETNVKLLERLRESMMNVNPDGKFAKWFERMDYDELIMQLHLGFSEKAYFQSIQGTVVAKPFSVEFNEDT